MQFVVEKQRLEALDKSDGGRSDHRRRREEMKRQISRPRPGHADLNGAIKYGHRDMRNVLERSSARETTVRA
ncbi:chorismate synthase [Bacillus sp. SL00103]